MKQILYIALIIAITGTIGKAQTASIPDPNFLSFLKSNFSKTINSSNQLIIAQAAKVTSNFDCSSQNISNLEGIQYFSGIQTLHAESNLLTSLPPLDSLVNLQKLIIHTNQLKSLPSLSNNTQLIQLIVYNNQLTSLPDLSALANLQKLDVGNNMLTVTPNVSANVRLQQLSLDRNYLTQGPNITGLDSLTQVQLHSNYFSFSILLPYAIYPGFSSNFTIMPQKKFPLQNKEILLNSSLDLSTNIDTSLST